MASYEFIEEFDTDDEEPQPVNTQSETNIVHPQIAFIPSEPRDWGQSEYQHPPNAGFNFNAFIPPTPWLTSTSTYYSAQNEYPPQPPPPSSISSQMHGKPPVVKRKRRRKPALLADFSPAIKTYAWQKFQATSLQKTSQLASTSDTSLERIRAEARTVESSIMTPMPLLTESIPTPTSQSFSHEDSNIRKLINKFKSQAAKRARQKRANLERKSARSKKTEAIDNWQIHQRDALDKQREQESLVKEAKISLVEVRRKKHLLQDKIKLLSSLEKLREVRRKQLINVKAGFSSDSLNSTKVFQEGVSTLKKQVEMVLQSVIKEEEMIALMAQSQCQHDEHEHQGKSINQKKSEMEQNTARVRRERKWQKYLYKKMLKLQGFVCHA